MSSTINRRVRRFGLMPTTFKDVEDGERKVKQADGKVITEKVFKKVPIRHSEALTPEYREEVAVKLRVADRERHLKFRAERKAGFPNGRATAAKAA